MAALARTAALLAVASARAQQPIECYDLFGAPLYRPLLTGAANESAQRNLEIARWEFSHDELADPAGGRVSSARSWVWLGRRLAYAGRFTDALDAFTTGRADLAKYPPVGVWAGKQTSWCHPSVATW